MGRAKSMKITSANALLRFNARTLSPEPDQLMGPESKAVLLLQMYLQGHTKEGTPTFLHVVCAIERLATEGIITARLATSLCRDLCAKFAKKEERAEVTVRLVIAGNNNDAFSVVNALLDNGVFQDAINDHDFDDAGKLRVVSAVAE